MHRFKAFATAAILGLAVSGATTLTSGVTAGATVAKPAVKATLRPAVRSAQVVRPHTSLRAQSGVGGSPYTATEDTSQVPEPGGASKNLNVSAHSPLRVGAQTNVGTSTPATEFQGINHVGQAITPRHTVTCPSGAPAGTTTCTASNYSFEPPDQMMCVGGSGGGTAAQGVLEGVNDAVALYSTAGALQAGPETINDFFTLKPEEIFATNSSGALLERWYGDTVATDPRCTYDTAIHRYIVLMLGLGQNSGWNAGGYTGYSSLFFSISGVNDPTTWTPFEFNVSNDGNGGNIDNSGNSNNCPCLGDQPLMGFNANGFYFTTNSYPFGGSNQQGRGFFYNGAQMYV